MTSHSLLPPDDRPTPSNEVDAQLRRQLEDSISRRFYEACDGVTQSLLTRCEWYMTTQSRALTLVINCPDAGFVWRVLNNMIPLGTQLERFSERARIRIAPPIGTGTPFEMRVDELSIYHDSDG